MTSLFLAGACYEGPGLDQGPAIMQETGEEEDSVEPGESEPADSGEPGVSSPNENDEGTSSTRNPDQDGSVESDGGGEEISGGEDSQEEDGTPDETNSGGAEETSSSDGAEMPAEGECEDATEDCPSPTEPCMEAYCDESESCKERAREDGPLSDWSWEKECKWATACAEMAEPRRGVRQVCRSGATSEEEDFEECTRDTEGEVVKEGEWSRCQAEENTKTGECFEVKKKEDLVCSGGKEQAEQMSEECSGSAEGEFACGACGNGILEEGELCEPALGWCSWDCNSRVVYVNESVAVEGDGRSWENAYSKLSEGLEAVRVFSELGIASEVWVAKGSYSPSEEGADTFQLPPGVALYGGFLGTERRLNFRAVDPRTVVTVLDGKEVANHVVSLTEKGQLSRIDGFTITGGKALSNPDDRRQEPHGGGIYVSVSVWSEDPEFGKLHLENLVITDNYAEENGGGIFAALRSLTLGPRVLFRRNRAGKLGGGARTGSEAFQVIDEVVFQENEAEDGGGIYHGGPLVLRPDSRLEFLRNEASNKGGGMFLNRSSVEIQDGAELKLGSNRAVHGGGVFMENQYGGPESLVVRDGGRFVFEGNTATTGSGGGFVCVEYLYDIEWRVEQGGSVSAKDNSAPDEPQSQDFWTLCELVGFDGLIGEVGTF